MTDSSPALAGAQAVPARKSWSRRAGTLPIALIFLAALIVPFVGNDYWVLIATRAAIYWILVSGLNLVVGFAGQLAIGYVALLTLGAYTASVLVAGNAAPPIHPFAALGVAAVVGAVAGVIVGLPALRLRTFYFAMTTLGFATIVTQVALAWQGVTGGGIGLPGPALPAPFDTAGGFYGLCLAIAAFCTWLTSNIAHSRFGRALVAIRDADVAAEAVGIVKSRLLVMIFLLSGATGALAGGLFASLQTYITPDAFTFELSVLFFISILIGGRGSILGPLIGTIVLTLLPEFAAPLAAWSTFLYAALLLAVVLAAPGGIAALLDTESRKPLIADRNIEPRPELLRSLLPGRPEPSELVLKDLALGFGGVRAVDGVDLTVKSGQVHGLIGPNGSGKTTTLNIISGYYGQDAGVITLGGHVLPPGASVTRCGLGIARTFQTPRIVGEASVLDNVMLGATIAAKSGFAAALLSLPASRQDEAATREHGLAALGVVGLGSLANVRCDRLQHSELRFLEIARALMSGPAFLLLDEPAAGLSGEEIARLGALVTAISQRGVGVLLVEHHTDLIFDICQHVTVLNLGRVLASGTCAEIRAHKEVVSAYLGS
jgi:ABC-type branched-subunit amino acid transport system ATPase component/ABC-type branched-subunit amino acid transport system permease subunit